MSIFPDYLYTSGDKAVINLAGSLTASSMLSGELSGIAGAPEFLTVSQITMRPLMNAVISYREALTASISITEGP